MGNNNKAMVTTRCVADPISLTPNENRIKMDGITEEPTLCESDELVKRHIELPTHVSILTSELVQFRSQTLPFWNEVGVYVQYICTSNLCTKYNVLYIHYIYALYSRTARKTVDAFPTRVLNVSYIMHFHYKYFCLRRFIASSKLAQTVRSHPYISPGSTLFSR
jgi:hypothetical protein